MILTIIIVFKHISFLKGIVQLMTVENNLQVSDGVKSNSLLDGILC